MEIMLKLPLKHLGGLQLNLSTRVLELTQSTTFAITARARELKLTGHDVLDLGVGEPDFNTPQYILEATKVAMDEGKTKYTPPDGVKELKDAIIKKFERENNLSYLNDQIIVTAGAKQALYNVFQVILNPGDEVIIPAPYWVSYVEQVKLAGGKPIIVQCEESQNFKISSDQLKKAVNKKTKAFILNSPCNPTGMIYTENELKSLGEVCNENDILVISDEIYEHLIYEDQAHVSIANLGEELFNRTVVISGLSKTYAMTGWRIGFAAGPKNIIKAMTSLSSHSTSNPTSIAQYGAIAALNGGYRWINEMKNSFKERRSFVVSRIKQIPSLECKNPPGAFYVFLNINKALGRFHSCNEWVKELLEKEFVATIPGTAFGDFDQYIRLSYATSLDKLEKALDRIERFIRL